jgi:signal transduction histidine kinase
LPSAKQSSTERIVGLAALGAVAVASGIAAGVGVADDNTLLAVAGIVVLLVASALAVGLLAVERRRHLAAEERLTEQASFLESLVDSIGRIAATHEEDAILEQTCREAERLLGARASFLAPGADPSSNGATLVPMRMRDLELGNLLLERDEPFARWEVVRATVLCDFAARATENARLLAEATIRDRERSLLSDRLITAEQDERRRLALILHDGAVQSLSGIGLMLEAAGHSIDVGKLDEAKKVLANALDRHRQTIRSLRDLSFNLEPVVLRDQGFGPAVAALAQDIGLSHGIQIDLDVALGESLAEKGQVALFQIIRETLDLAIHRGPPTQIAIGIAAAADGSVETVITDDGAGERRRSNFDAIAERARTINGRLLVEAGDDGGTAIRIVLPPYVARR